MLCWRKGWKRTRDSDRDRAGQKWHEVHYPDHSGREDILHVVPAGEDWAVTAEGREHPLMTAQTKQEAVQYAQHRKADIVIHRQDGTIQSRRTT